MLKRTLLLLTVSTFALAALPAQALDWSDNAFHYWWGPAFAEPGNPNNVPKNILSFTHVDGYKWGGNFLNIDMLYSYSGKADNVQGLTEVKSAGATEVYVVYRHNLSLNKITGSKAFEVGGVLRDVGIELGADLNTKHNAFAARKIMPVAGLSASLNVPGFLNVGVLLDKEWNTNAIVGKEVTFDVTPMLTAAWGIPVFGPIAFEGFALANLPKGKDGFGADTKTEVLLHPKVMVDLGTLWGSKGYQIGAGWEYWLNKFGNDNDAPGSLGNKQSTVFLEAAIHL
ncbi:MAG TPA: hypothetical protein VF400_04590 [Anaeromyxobacteraceae bacterium]